VSGDGYRIGEMERIALAASSSDLRSDLLSARQEIERLRAELRRLRRWKSEAATVIGDWEAVFDSLIAPSVGAADLGKSKSALTAKEIIRLCAENERLTDELQQVANEIALAESEEARRER
jgi:hypothetical protein